MPIPALEPVERLFWMVCCCVGVDVVGDAVGDVVVEVGRSVEVLNFGVWDTGWGVDWEENGVED